MLFLRPRRNLVTNKGQLKRHGARWPTVSSGKGMEAAVGKLKGAKYHKEGYLEFLKNFQLDLVVEDLLPLGAKQYDR